MISDSYTGVGMIDCLKIPRYTIAVPVRLRPQAPEFPLKSVSYIISLFKVPLFSTFEWGEKWGDLW